MKKYIVFILILFTVVNLYSQDKTMDSLKLRLSEEKNDTVKIQLLIGMGRRFGFGMQKNDSTLWYSQRALELSKKINYIQGEVLANNSIATYLNATGNYPEALKISLKNVKLAEQNQQVNALFIQTRLIGWIYENMGDHKKHLEYEKKLSVIARSGIYTDSTLRERYSGMADNCVSQAYSSMNMDDSALHYMFLFYKRSIKMPGEGVALATVGLANIYSKLRNDDSAFFFYRACIPYAKEVGRRDVAANAQLGMADLFYKKGRLDSAFFYTRKSLDELQNTDDPGKVMSAYSLLSELYKSRHQYDSAYKYMKDYVIMKDSVFNQNKIVQAQDFGFSETMQQQQLAQAKKEAEERYENHLKFYILGAVIFIFLIIAFLLYRNLSNKQKANILLGKQNEEIQTTLSELKSTQAQLIQSEKMASLGELTAGIAHEIQNPLNFVNNFSEVNKELIEELNAERLKPVTERNENVENEILNDIKENEEKINHHGKRADAIVKGMLQHSRNSNGIKEPTDINALCDEYLRLSYHGLRAKDKSFNATIKTDFDDSIGNVNIISQDMGRVILNLLTNAFYAVNEKKQLLANSHELIEIKVADNGNGIPSKVLDKIFQPFFTTKPTGQGTGLGLSLSYDIITKGHGGELNVETKEGIGTTFIIVIPVTY